MKINYNITGIEIYTPTETVRYRVGDAVESISVKGEEVVIKILDSNEAVVYVGLPFSLTLLEEEKTKGIEKGHIK